MINDLNKYKISERPKFELASEDITLGIYNKIWGELGYNSIYYLGAVSFLRSMVKSLNRRDEYTKMYLLVVINSIKQIEGVPDNIKELVDVVLDEFEYKDKES
jgi:ABC-type polysaccharide transport system permease subunit